MGGEAVWGSARCVHFFWLRLKGAAVSSPASSIPAHTHHSEQQELHLFDCLEKALRSLSSLQDQFQEYKRLYPPRKNIEYMALPVSDTLNPILCKKLGRQFLYILSPQNITLSCSDFTSPALSLSVQAGVLQLLPFPEGTRLVSTSSIADSSPVKVLTIASDERLI